MGWGRKQEEIGRASNIDVRYFAEEKTPSKHITMKRMELIDMKNQDVFSFFTNQYATPRGNELNFYQTSIRLTQKFNLILF